MWCCCHRPAPVMTSTRTTRHAVSIFARSSRRYNGSVPGWSVDVAAPEPVRGRVGRGGPEGRGRCRNLVFSHPRLGVIMPFHARQPQLLDPMSSNRHCTNAPADAGRCGEVKHGWRTDGGDHRAGLTPWRRDQRRHMMRWLQLWGGLLLVAVVSGCTVRPHYRPPAVPVPDAWSAAATQAEGEAVTAQWWTTFQDPLLESLIARAVLANRDLRTAAARVREARALRGLA